MRQSGSKRRQQKKQLHLQATLQTSPALPALVLDDSVLQGPQVRSESSVASKLYTGLLRDPPTIDYDEWQQHLSARELKWAKSELRGIAKTIEGSTRGPIGGHWSRHERQHGRLQRAFPRSPWAKAIAAGIKYYPTRIPPQDRIPNPRLDERDRRMRVLMVKHWIAAGVIVPISQVKWREFKAKKRRLFFLHLFLIQKNGKSGDYYSVDEITVGNYWRGCLNAKPLNPFLQHGHYKAHNSKTFDAAVTATPGGGGTYMTCTDVSGAFTTQALSEEPLELDGPWSSGMSRPWGSTSSPDLGCFDTKDPEFATTAPRGFQTATSMFGFSPNPFNWQKAYSLVQDYWTQQGAGSTGTVMDDNMVVGTHPTSKAQAVINVIKHLKIVVDAHGYFGIPLSPKDAKAIYPTTVRKFNGTLYDSVHQLKWIDDSKRASILRSMRCLLRLHQRKRQVSAKLVATCIGKAGAASAMLFGVRCYTNQLQRSLTRILDGGMIFARTGYLREPAAQQLEWLISTALRGLNGMMMVHGKRVDYKVTTDFSGVGLGGVLQPTKQVPDPPVISIKLPPKWRSVWSGSGETFGGGAMVMAFAKHYGWHDCIVTLVMDNIAAICYWNKQGHSSDEELNAIMRPFLDFLRMRCIMLMATYCPGAIIEADEPSRRAATVWEYFLCRSIFETLEQVLLGARGAVTFDLCASMANAQTAKYASLLPDPYAEWVDCTKHPWKQEYNRYYAFPPPILTRILIEKAAAEEQTLLLVSPAWTKLHLQRITQMLIEVPVVIPWTEGTVLNPHEGRYKTEQAPEDESWSRWLLVGYLISGDRQEFEAKRPKLQKLTLQDWLDRQPILSNYTTDGAVTAKAYQWIQFAHRMMQS